MAQHHKSSYVPPARSVAAGVFKRCKRRVFRSTSSVWFSRRIMDPVADAPPSLPVDVTFLCDDKSGLVEWLRSRSKEFPWIYIQKEIETGETHQHIYVVIEHEQKIIGYVKIGVNETYIHDFERVVRLLPRTVLIYDTFVLPEFRKKHIALHGVSQTLLHLQGKGYETIWCHIESWNKASLRTFEKAGFQARASIRYSRLFGVPFFLKNRFQPFFRFEDFINAEELK